MPSFTRFARARLLLALTLAGAAPAAAQALVPSPTETTIYLLTMGQGDMVWEKFGHDAI